MSQNKQKSDTLRQRDKARKDFLELKRMQQEAQENEKEEHVPYSGEIKPDTFAKKVEHFFYYYGKITIACIVGVIIVVVAVMSCMNRENPDIRMVFYDAEALPDMYLKNIEAYFEKICPDYNGDGEVVVSIINCTYTAGDDSAEYQFNQQQKLQTLVATDKDTMLFVSGQTGYMYLSGITDDFLGAGVALPESYYKECQIYEEIPMPQGMVMYVRNIEGTLIEDNAQVQKNHKNALDFLEKIKGLE